MGPPAAWIGPAESLHEMPEMRQARHVSHHRYHREGETPRVPLLRRARPPASGAARGGAGGADHERDRQEADRQRPGSLREPSPADKQVCPVCQVTFLEFRNSGRLGCPYDYEVFRDELMPLLENIHGETRHSGKVPRRAPRNTQQQTTLIQLRNELKRAVAAEDYEVAAGSGTRSRGSRRADTMTTAPHRCESGARPRGRPPLIRWSGP